MSDFQPSRRQADLAEVIELLLDKGIVINADIAVSVGDTQLLGIQVRAAIASFETAAKYGLEFPEGTDMRRVAEAVGDPELAEEDRPRVPVDPVRGVNISPSGPRQPTGSDAGRLRENEATEESDGGSAGRGDGEVNERDDGEVNERDDEDDRTGDGESDGGASESDDDTGSEGGGK